MKHVAASSAMILLSVFAPCATSAADYLRDVKPLLAHKCYACHGVFKQQAGLRLDTAVSILQGGDSGSPIVAGKPDESLLMGVLTGDAGFRMPPENEGSPLTQEELDLVREWIAAGAPAPAEEEPQPDSTTWWSYQPIARPDVPQVAEADWCRTPVDYFIAAEREKRNLPHVAAADKAVWLRRVYLDLIGLPPTRAELQRFLADNSQQAYETVVDDLLSRPQYGERWGRHWMDVWRYSDWYGSRGINEIRYSQRHIWRWRDWIVRSLNDDKGYDQMVREMLAADELAGDDPTILPATGFLGRNWYKFDRDVWMFETVERTGEAFLGLTLRCCRCHDHKFDPVSQEEYYRFRAFFEPHDVRTDPVSALAGTQKDSTLGDVLTDGIALVYDKEPEAPTYLFERGDSRYPDKSKPLAPGVPAALGGIQPQIGAIELPPEAWYPTLRPALRASLLVKTDQAIQAARKNLDDCEQAATEAQAKLQAFEQAESASAEPAIFLHDDFAMARPDVWKTVRGNWVYENGRLVQNTVTSFATIVTQQNHPSDFRLHLRYRPLQPGTYRSIGFSFDYQDQGNSQDVYTSTNDQRQSVQAFHRLDGKQVYPQAGIVYTELKLNEEAVLDVNVLGSQLTIDLNGERKLEYALPVPRRDGKFALWVHEGAAEFLELKITAQAESRETLERREREARRAVESAEAGLRLAEAEKKSVESRLNAAVAAYLGEDLEQARQLALMAAAAERAVTVLKAEIDLSKLDGTSESEEAQKAFKAAEKALDEARQAAAQPSETFTPVGQQYPTSSTGRRTALANWIAGPDNPRTARVAANHLWGRHFGRPLVATPENFGMNGRKPTHPALLDWLAAELVANDWRMKPIHRQIVLSSTYRQSSSGAGLDSALAADPENTYYWRMNSRRMEAEVVRDSTLYLAGRLDLTMGGPEIPETDGESVLRRSMYFRNTPNEKMLMLEVFDVADPNSCYRRKESVIPHQSLAMMNSGLTVDHARLIAEQLAAAGPDDFVTTAFETVLARSPTELEAARCEEFLNKHVAARAGGEVESFAGGGSAKRSPSSDPQMRARENLVHVLLMHNDFVTVR